MLLKSISLKNILSYGSEMETLTLAPLNVLIGPNASGKSNLIDAISLLAAAPRDILEPIRGGGGIGEWLWKGGKYMPTAAIEATFFPPGQSNIDIHYHLEFTASRGPLSRFELFDERIESVQPAPGADKPFIYYAYQNGHPVLSYVETNESTESTESLDSPRKQRQLRQENVSSEKSILSQRREAELYPELNHLATQLEQIRCYRPWEVGRYNDEHYSVLRLFQRADLPDDFLLEDASNLGMMVNSLQNYPDIKDRLLELLKTFYPDIKDIVTRVQSNRIQIFFHEVGLREPVSAMRLSDGTLRYLCLLTILCHPQPPPLICLEEPELGMHPDILPTLTELLKECAERTQLIITTHSDIIIDALSERSEAVIVCEKNNEQGTQLKRLESDRLKSWLKEYSLGHLWRKGEIGGNRW